MNKVSVYFLRTITHNWPVNENIKILKNLHAAAPADGKLIIADLVIPHVCADSQEIIGIERPSSALPPAPLLANWGEVQGHVYTVDFTMAALLNSQERTLDEFKELTEATGWKIQKVYQNANSSFSQLLCTKF